MSRTKNATEVELSDDSQKRRWCFTWNNYPEDTDIGGKVMWQEILIASNPKFIFVGREIAPTTGTKHLQGYIEFKGGKRLTTLKKIDKGIHWSACKGNQKENIVYCSKSGDTWEWGEGAKQGERNDLNAARDIIKNGGSMLEVADNNFGSFVRYHRGFREYQYLIEQQAARELRPNLIVEIRQGPSGTGKTRSAIEEGLKDYGKYYISSEGNTGLWWTGYQGDKYVIIDEFRCTIPLHILLRILDIYPVQVPIHGSYAWLRAEKIIITSNVDPETWYKSCDDASRAALLRRIHKITKMEQRHFL